MKWAFVAWLAFCAGCVKDCFNEATGGWGLDIPGYGVVFLCHWDGSDDKELCWRDDNGSDLEDGLAVGGFPGASCESTPRHIGICDWSDSCDGGGGSNALNGPWCVTP